METSRARQVRLAYNKDNALNAICPYFTMFPLEYPLRSIKKHKGDGAVVLDPFCGRGTTLFAARNLGLSAWGIDSSPVAVAIARAKLATCKTEEPLDLAARLVAETHPADVPDSSFFANAYHPEALRDLCALREGLMSLESETDASALLRAAALGCLHGPLPKNIDNAGYLSNQMPRTYASKPDYAVRFWKERGLQAPKIDLLKVLRRKVERLKGISKKSPNAITQVMCADAQHPCSYLSILEKPSVVVTSPPYYGMRTYVQDQWLRNWFLGGPSHVDYSAGAQLDHGGQGAFAKSLGAVWKNVGAHASEKLHMYVRFGIIPSASVNAKKLFLESLKASGVEWRVVSVRPAKAADAGKRQADQMKAKSSAAIEFDFHVVRS